MLDLKAAAFLAVIEFLIEREFQCHFSRRIVLTSLASTLMLDHVGSKSEYMEIHFACGSGTSAFSIHYSAYYLFPVHQMSFDP